MTFHNRLKQVTLEKIRHSLIQHMPEGPQQDFYLWGLSSDNPAQDDFLQMVGMNQIINLSTRILQPLVQLEDWERIAEYSGMLHAYFMYELVSDDLAVGLSLVHSKDPSIQLRKDILHSFNGAMVKRLSGVPDSSAAMLEYIHPSTIQIDGYNQTSIHDKYTKQFSNYRSAITQMTGNELKFELWPVLVANIETCKELVDMVDQLQVGPIIRQGFINRYASVSQSLEAHLNMTLEELTNIGTHTVSVIPVLAYLTGVLAEELYPQEQIRSIIEDGLLEDALTSAAIITRLLNDIGVVATYATGKRTSLIHSLWKSYESKPLNVHTITQLLCHVAKKNEALTRFEKDITYGEFNICLHNLAYTESIEYGISVFSENLTYFAQLYRQAQIQLRDQLATINRRMQTKAISNLIVGFVNFHEHIYAHPFDTAAGEYVA